MIAASFIWRPQISHSTRFLISPPPYMEFYSFGHHEVIADSLWIRAVQDYDYCEEQLAVQLCKGSGWLFHMLDTITNLSPKFRIAYVTGGLTLTVIVSDYEGATKIFDKGVAAFPNDLRMLYTAAYHSLFEEKNPAKAAERLVAAARNGGPPWMYSLASRLYTEAGQKELGLKLYSDLKSNPDTDPGVLKRMAKKLGLPD